MTSATQLKSGNWRCVAYLGMDKNGKKIQKSFTAPTKKQAEELAKACVVMEKKSFRIIDDKNATVMNAIDRYIAKSEESVKKGKISPTTVTAYKSMKNNLFDEIADIPALKLTDKIINEWIDTIEEDHSPKTCKNAWSLCRAALMEVLPRSTVIDWRIELPKIPQKKIKVPLEKEIQVLLNYVQHYDRDMYAACLLAAFGTLRRSEICALTAEDIDRKNCIVHVNKALVLTEKRDWVLKGTKTELSTRDVELPAFVINALPKDGNIVKINPSRVSDRFAKYLIRLGLHFRFHDLRHYSASIMNELGASDVIIQNRGGWSNIDTINEHYKGSMNEYEAKFTKKLNKYFERKFAI